MFKDFNLIVVGSGLFGSVVAEQASRAGYRVAVVESRNHIGGNCYTEDDKDTNINVHKYGPHIFHTSNKQVWDYINQFTEFNHYRHKVRSMHDERTYSIPINLETINGLFRTNLTPKRADDWLAEVRKRFANPDPKNFEEQALALVGPELYNAFIKGYTEKQWETDPKELPASVARRLPVRTSYNDRYYDDTWEGIPVHGYTPIFEKMLTHENIKVFLDTDWFAVKDQAGDIPVVYTGPIDRYYDYCHGRLKWRTLDFKFETRNVPDFQGVCAMNYPDKEYPYVRVIEHKHFHPERKDYSKNQTVIHYEYSRTAKEGDTVYYPVNTVQDQELYKKYKDLADQEANVFFGGRLGEYMYYDMHQVIGSALACYRNKISVKLQK
jgi:UDP-galactopyranose mutase